MTIYEQLETGCNCIKVTESNIEFVEKNIDELINLISVYTCWTQKPCETFLMSERREVIDLPPCSCGCDVFTFTPFFYPFVSESFSFKLVEQNGIEETVTELTDYVYSAVDENFRIDLPLEDCKCRPQCGCPSTYKLLVTYDAGYELIPECLIPVLCNALGWITDKNDCCCTDCEACDDSDDAGVIDLSTLEGRLQDYFLEVLTNQYKRQLGLISLCNRHAQRIWGFVV